MLVSPPCTNGNVLGVSGISNASRAASLGPSPTTPLPRDLMILLVCCHLLSGHTYCLVSSNIINSVGSTISHRERLIIHPDGQVNCNPSFVCFIQEISGYVKDVEARYVHLMETYLNLLSTWRLLALSVDHTVTKVVS